MPPTTSAWGTSGAAGRCAARRWARACGPGVQPRAPDVVIGTDAETWCALREGELSGIEAFSQRRLYARGDLDLAVGFEGLFRLPSGRPPLLRIHDVPVGKLKLSTLTIGEGPDLLLLHGLGSAKSSFFDTAAALSRHYRVHALDLPGFGGSSKPSTAPYGAPYAAKAVIGAMDALGIERAHIVGNSMGGRVAIEVGLSGPIASAASRCCARPWRSSRRDWHWLVRVLRPELGLLPHSLGREPDRGSSSGRCSPTATSSTRAWRTSWWTSSSASTATRAPGWPSWPPPGRSTWRRRSAGSGFYPRLAGLRPPALFVWSSHDRLIPERFRPHVERWLPQAEQVVLQGCGHVPQVERPEQTNGLLERFFARVDALGGPATGLRAA